MKLKTDNVRTGHRWLCGALAALALLSGSLDAQAARKHNKSVAELMRQLKTHIKPRMRARAAMALGESGTKDAVAPLCSGLRDKQSSVRAASALALGALSQGGKRCLERRYKRERVAAVKQLIRKAIRTLRTASADAINAQTRYYLALGAIKNKSGQQTPFEQSIRSLIQASAKKLGGIVVAPKGETSQQARQKLAGFPNVDAYLFETKVDRERQGDKLTVKVKVSLFSYPANSMLGSITRTAAMTGVEANDNQAEAELAEHAVQALMQAFSKMAKAG